MGFGVGLRAWLATGVQLFHAKAFVPKSIKATKDTRASGAPLKRCLGAAELVLLGVGAIVGAGVFVVTGVAAREHAGPAVVVAYLVASVAALLSAVCFTEFAVDVPVAGAAYNYVGITFGELPAWIVAASFLAESTLGSAAIARGLTSYTATLFGKGSDFFRISVGEWRLDPPAFAVIMAQSWVLARGVKQGARLNSLITGINMVVIALMLGAAFPNVDMHNYTPFSPKGTRGVFAASGQVFFSFLGFTMAASVAEEVKNPSVNLPRGIIGSLVISLMIYVLMSLAITGMRPYEQIDIDAPFSEAFAAVGDAWMSKVVSFGAVTGLLTSLLVGLLGTARTLVVLGRERLLPQWFAKVEPANSSPVRAAYVTGMSAAILGFFAEIEFLAKLVSMGTFVIYNFVAAGVLTRRYVNPDTPGSSTHASRVLLLICALIASALSASISYTLHAHWAVPLALLCVWALVTASFARLPVAWRPRRFAVPLSPLTPCATVLINTHLIASLGVPALVGFAVWIAGAIAVYFLYSVHHSTGVGGQDMESSSAHGAIAAIPNEAGPASLGKPVWSPAEVVEDVEMMAIGYDSSRSGTPCAEVSGDHAPLLGRGALSSLSLSDAPQPDNLTAGPQRAKLRREGSIAGPVESTSTSAMSASSKSKGL